MRRSLVIAVLLGLVGGGAETAAASVITSDIVFIVDESGSMSDVQANLRNNIGLFAGILADGGIDARFALVGYGNAGVRPRLLTDFTSAAGFAAAAQRLEISGGTEPGYSAIAFGLNGIDGQTSLLNYRTDTVRNLILFTDEPSNGDNCVGCLTGGNSTTLGDADLLLSQSNALFNAVLREQNTIASYKPLADGHFGNVYDLNRLNTTNQAAVRQFVQEFATSKLQETRAFCELNPTDPACIPEPAMVLLVASGLGFAVARRRGVRWRPDLGRPL